MLLEQRKEISVDRWPLEGDDTVGMLGKALTASHGILLFGFHSVCEIRARNAFSACFSFTATVPVEW
jgi:hypothetical protein